MRFTRSADAVDFAQKVKNRTWYENRANPRVCTVRFNDTVPVEKQRFRQCPDQKRQNRTKPRFCTVYSHVCAPCREKAALYGFPTWSGTAPQKKNVQRGIAPRRTVGFLIHEKPHRIASKVLIYLKTEPNRTVGFPTSVKPHREVSDF